MPSETQDQTGYRDDYFGILDVFVVLAESWLILLVGVILAASAALVSIYLEPKTYAATAIVSLTPTQGALITAPAVLDPVAAETGILAANAASQDTARNDVRSRITIDLQSNVGLYDIAMRGRSPDEAKQVLDELFTQLGIASRPAGEEREELEERAARLEREIVDIDSVWQAFAEEPGLVSNSPGRGSEVELYGRSLVALQQEVNSRRAELAAVRDRLEGFGSAQIVQPPIALQQPLAQNKRKLVIMAVGAMTVFLLALMFLRELWRRANVDPVNSAKIRRIKQAFWLGGTKSSA